MTTICYRDGVLAGDSRVTVGDMVLSDNILKVHRLSNNTLLGWAGSAEHAHILKEAMTNGGEIHGTLDVLALWIQEDGTIYLWEGNTFIKQSEPYYAIGSGSPYAIGAMDAGATAEAAAQIGSRRDVGSGGKIRTVRFKAPPTKRKNKK